jgi:hypothetical protein
MDGACSTDGRDKKMHKVFGLENLEGKRPLSRLERRLEDNIRIGIREIEWKHVYWMHLAQVRDQWRVIVNIVMSVRVR